MSTPETVRVRVAVMINGKGEWNAEGWCDGQTERIIEELRHTFMDCERLDERGCSGRAAAVGVAQAA